MMGDLFQRSSAVISNCGRYRYRLDRRWGDGATCGFIMLNPSTADAFVDDATIRRCIGFAQREGLSGLRVVNLFGFRASKPSALVAAEDPVGPGNELSIDLALQFAAHCGTPVVAAWGAWRHPAFDAKIPNVRLMANMYRMPLHCLGTTQAGHPRHPLYVRADQPLEEWS